MKIIFRQLLGRMVVGADRMHRGIVVINNSSAEMGEVYLRVMEKYHCHSITVKMPMILEMMRKRPPRQRERTRRKKRA